MLPNILSDKHSIDSVETQRGDSPSFFPLAGTSVKGLSVGVQSLWDKIANYPDFPEGEKFILDGSLSYDPEGSDLMYEWALNNDGVYNDAIGVTTETAFFDDGIYIIGLKVTDEYGESDTDTVEITIFNVAPTMRVLLLQWIRSK